MAQVAPSLREVVRAVDARLHPRNEPTRTQVRVVNFIRDYRLRNGAGPSIREVADAVGVRSTGDMARRLKVLFSQGLIFYVPGEHRSLAVKRQHPMAIDLPDDLFVRLTMLIMRGNISMESAIISILRGDLHL
jgi:SOS-response transcriptional repressor LexA